MHVQAKSSPALSPEDLKKFLSFLAGDVNIEGVTGSGIEGEGGQIVFTVAHGQEARAHDLLTEAGYTVQWTTDLYAEEIQPETANQPGVLFGIIERASESGRAIDTVLIGMFTDDPSGRLFCQCTWLGANWQSEPPAPEEAS
jgi:hypothetical protein